MAFLAGAFGSISLSDIVTKLSNQCEKYAQPSTLQKIKFKNGIILGGSTQTSSHKNNHVIQMPAKQGIIVGKLFDSMHHKPIDTHDPKLQFIALNPASLTRNFWGRYVGALYDNQNHQCTLLRDPQGLSTIFYTIQPDGILFSTEISLLYDACDQKPSIDMTYFAEYIINSNQALSTTPFESIKELLPGMSLTIDTHNNITQQQLWNIENLDYTCIKNEEEFEHELLHTLKACTKVWTEDSHGVCVELSGGTDSSALLILLRDILPEHKKLIAINYIDSKNSSSNEIEYAQEVADICNVSLQFIDSQTSSIIDPIPHTWRPNKPNTFLLFYNENKQLIQLLEQQQCTEIMNGQGGDHVFLAPQPKEAIADYWLEHGLRGIKKPLQELTDTYRMPLWELFTTNTKALSYYYRNKHIETKINAPILNLSFMKQIKQQEFYLQPSLKKFYPAKAKHIQNLAHGIIYADRNNRLPGYTFTHPLLSQPVVELGLKIPTYQSFDNNYDRIFFRRAVSRIQKPKALWRRVKGGTTGTMMAQFALHAEEIQQTIMQGMLAKSGMINVQWVEQQLTKTRHGQTDNMWPLLYLLTAQMWLNQWKLT